MGASVGGCQKGSVIGFGLWVDVLRVGLRNRGSLL